MSNIVRINFILVIKLKIINHINNNTLMFSEGPPPPSYSEVFPEKCHNIPKEAIITPQTNPELNIENLYERILFLENIVNATLFPSFKVLIQTVFNNDNKMFYYLISKFTFKNYECGKFGNGQIICPIRTETSRDNENLKYTLLLLNETCKGGSIEIMKYLIDLGININQSVNNRFDYCQCINQACKATNYNMVKLLLENNAIISSNSNWYGTSNTPEGHKIKNIMEKYGANNVKLGPIGKILINYSIRKLQS